MSVTNPWGVGVASWSGAFGVNLPSRRRKPKRCEWRCGKWGRACRNVHAVVKDNKLTRCPCCKRWYCRPHLHTHWRAARLFSERGMGLFNDLRERGVYTGYEKYVVELEPVLDEMGKRGVPVDPARHAEVKAELERRLNNCYEGIQALVPDEVRAVHPKQGYKKVPKGAVEGASTTVNVTKGGVKQKVACEWAKRDFLTKINEGLYITVFTESRWVKLLPWTPSHDGLLRYIKFRNHPVPRDFKTGAATTLELEIKRLANQTHDMLYLAVIEYRQNATVLNNHMKNWTPCAHGTHTIATCSGGRVHPTWYYDTGTGQLATRRPNVQNAPKHGEDAKKEIADMFRSMICAKPGHTLLEFDYRSFHAQTLAFEARDKDYLRLAKLDIHSYLTAHLIRHPERDRLLNYSDAELADRLIDIYKRNSFIRDFKAKRAILGYGFGMGYRKLYNMNKESFDSQADAKRVVDTLNGLFPVANKWRDTIRRQAHEQGYLTSRFGCIRWFWEVMRWAGGDWQPGGDDSEAAVAFLPANDAFCTIKDAMLRLNETVGYLGRYGLINQIHDALMFECPDPLVDEAIATIPAEMERPSLILIDPVVAPDGLSVEVSVAMGKSWDKMEKLRRSPRSERK